MQVNGGDTYTEGLWRLRVEGKTQDLVTRSYWELLHVFHKSRSSLLKILAWIILCQWKLLTAPVMLALNECAPFEIKPRSGL